MVTADSAWVLNYVRSRAVLNGRVARMNGMGVSDLSQELLLSVIEGLPNHRPSFGSNRRLVSCILKRRLVGLIRKAVCQKRLQPGRFSHIDEIDKSALPCPDEFAEIDTRLDVESILGSLTPDNRLVCEMLKTRAPSDAARELGWEWKKMRAFLTSMRDVFSGKLGVREEGVPA